MIGWNGVTNPEMGLTRERFPVECCFSPGVLEEFRYSLHFVVNPRGGSTHQEKGSQPSAADLGFN